MKTKTDRELLKIINHRIRMDRYASRSEVRAAQQAKAELSRRHNWEKPKFWR